MGGCQSTPSHTDHDLQIPVVDRHPPREKVEDQRSPSPRFITSYSPATVGVNYSPFITQTSQAPWQDSGMIRSTQVPGQRMAVTFGKPETSSVYQPGQQLDLFSAASTEKHSFSPPKNRSPERHKEPQFEIKYPFTIDRPVEEQDFYAPLDKDHEIREKESAKESVRESHAEKESNAERYSLPKEIFVPSKDPKAIVYEGYLLKYKPGTGFNWVERWCTLNHREFRYYKDQYSARCWENKPLVTVKISDIISALRVNINLPSFDQKKEPLNIFKNRDLRTLFYFEVFDQRNELLESEEALGNRSVELYDQQDGPYPIQKDHLMRPPITQRMGKKPRDQASPIGSHRESHAQNSARANLGSGVSPDRVTARDTHGQYSRWVKDKTDLASWTGRENEWYYSEKRLLFATPDLEEREKWMGVLEWIIHEDEADHC